MTFDIAYVGDRGRKQQQSREGGIDFDQLPVSDLALGLQLNDTVANPYFGLITTGTLADATTSTGQLLKRYSQFTSVLPLFLSGGNSQMTVFNCGLTNVSTRVCSCRGHTYGPRTLRVCLWRPLPATRRRCCSSSWRARSNDFCNRLR
jgi:hypothetical protein